MAKPVDWRLRITGLEYHKPEELLDHAYQWRVHPKAQVDAMVGVLGDIGITDALRIYRSERAGGKLVTWDGHLRKKLRGGVSWPCLMTDLTDAESDEALATHDSLAAMAVADREQLDELLRSVSSSDSAVQQMLAELAEKSGLHYGENAVDVDPEQAHRTLAERFVVPPFSVLDARQGYWQERKRAWLALGIQSELGRGENQLDVSATVAGITDPEAVAAWNKQRRESPRHTLGAIAPNEAGDHGILTRTGKYAVASAEGGGRERVAPKMAMHNDPMQRKHQYDATTPDASDRTS